MSVLTNRWGRRGVVLLAGLLLVAGSGTGAFLIARRGTPSPAPAPHRFDVAADVPGATAPGPAPAVLPGADDAARAPDPATLARMLRPMLQSKGLGPEVSADVLDPATGKHLLGSDRDTDREPASTAKLLTGAAALTVLGGQTTLPTRAVLTGGTVTLVGGGDVMLGTGRGDPEVVDGRAGLKDLAEQTARELRARGAGSVRVRLDDDLFGSQVRSPRWSPGDVSLGFVAPLQPLEVDAGRLKHGDYAPRAADPAMAATSAFVRQLRDAGVRVKGAPGRGSAERGAAVLGQVESAPVSDLVEFALSRSDNTVAEALARLVALKTGRPATFAGSGAAVLAEASSLGLDLAGARLSDGSGLGEGSRLPASALSGVLGLAAGPDRPQLRPLLTGLPIAGVSGTLSSRFTGKGERAAAGVVRAKTGTLSGVSALAGSVVDADGRQLVFVVMADRVASTLAARATLDRLVTTLAACGCR